MTGFLTRAHPPRLVLVAALVTGGGGGLMACDRARPVEASQRGETAAVCSPESVSLDSTLLRIEREIQEVMQREGIPGAAAGVVCGDSLIWSRGYGVLAVDDTESVTASTRFRIASVTKVFTAAAVMKLWEEGRIGLDDPVDRHLPWFSLRRPPAVGTDPVTIRHLLTHTAGVPPNSSLTDFPRLYQPARRQAIAVLLSQALQSAPGASYSYSNLGYGVLGDLVATVSGVSYAEFLRREILRPLGMTTTLVHPRPTDHVAWGSGPLDRRKSRARAGFWDLGFFTPAGGMASSVHELGRFLAQQLAPYRGEPTVALRPGTLREMHRVQFPLAPGSIDLGVDGVTGVGLAWAVDRTTGHVIYHTGGLPEQTSYLMIDLEAQVGMVFLTNAQGAGRGVVESMLGHLRTAITATGQSTSPAG